jgi:hypothetical protein
MALSTDPALQNQLIYCVYVRAHTAEGSKMKIMDR